MNDKLRIARLEGIIEALECRPNREDPPYLLSQIEKYKKVSKHVLIIEIKGTCRRFLVKRDITNWTYCYIPEDCITVTLESSAVHVLETTLKEFVIKDYYASESM